MVWSALDAVGVGVVVVDPRGQILHANAAAEPLLDLPGWRGLAVRAHERGVATRDVRVETTTSDGVRVALRITAVPNGDHVIVTLTEPVAVKDEHAASRLQAVTDAVPGIIYQYALEDGGRERFTFVAGSVRELMGISPCDALADPQHVWSHCDPEDAKRLREAILRSRDRLSFLDFEMRVSDGDRWRWVRVHANPQRFDTGTLWTGFVLDVTDHHKLAEGLRIAQRREAMGDLAAGLAHNFNNMLAVMLPNIEAARALHPDAEPLLADAAAATARASELVRQILYVARGADDSSVESVDLVRVVKDVIALCRRTFDRTIHIVERIRPTSAPTLGATSHLQQVVLNLCLNARDALVDRPVPTIELELSSDGDRHVLVVRDNGCGIPEETRARLGELFFTTKPPGRGTGLGLATVYGTMRDIDGTIEVTSEPGLSTTFTLTFPASAPIEEAEHVVSVAPPSRKRRVLVVDDEHLVRRALRRTLAARGHQVEEAASGVEAVARLEAGEPVDLVLLDLSMPGMSGRDTLAWIKAREGAPEVIILSGDTSSASDLEAAAVLEKPVRGNELLAAIARVPCLDDDDGVA